MFHKLVIAISTVFALLTVQTAFANTRPPAIAQSSPALHLMNDGEFAVFLERLDADLAGSKGRLQNVDIKSLNLESQESKELEKSQTRCLQSLDNVREDIQYLVGKQTLKFDLLLLIDLNELARNLDALDQGLMNPASALGAGAARKSLDYARAVIGIDSALAPRINAFQNHVLAFSGVIDATLIQNEQEADQSPTQK